MGSFEPAGLWGHQAELISNLSEVLGPREGIFSKESEMASGGMCSPPWFSQEPGLDWPLL